MDAVVVRIPGLLDVLTVRDPDALTAAADDARLDRPVPGRGPALNRLIGWAARETLTARGQRLPSALSRADYRRSDMRSALAVRLEAKDLDAALAEPVRRAANYVAGGEGDAVELAQALIGPAVIDGYAPTRESVKAAETIGKALNGSFIYRLVDRIRGGSRRARSVLHGMTDGDLTAVHALAIAAQNMAASLKALRDMPKTASADAALARAMIAPRRVVRQCVAPGEMLGGSFRPGTIVMLRVEDATRRTLDPRVAFLSEAWSGCPAHAFVPKVLRCVWDKAKETS